MQFTITIHMFNFFKRNRAPNPEETNALADFIKNEAELGRTIEAQRSADALKAFSGETSSSARLQTFEKSRADIESQEQIDRRIQRLRTRLSSAIEAARVFADKNTDSNESLQQAVDRQTYTKLFSDTGSLGAILERVSLAENLRIFDAPSITEFRENIHAANTKIADAEIKYDKFIKQKSVLPFIGRYAKK